MLHSFNRSLELSDRLETNYLRILYYDFPQNYSDTYKSYEYSRLCTIAEGEKLITYDQTKSDRYDPGKFLLMPPESNIHMTISKPTKAVVFELSDSLIKTVSANVSEDYNLDYDTLMQDCFLCAKQDDDFKEVLGKVAHLISSRNKDMEYLLDLYAQEMVYILIKMKGVRHLLSYEPDSLINRTLSYMKKSYGSPISIGKMADELHMSESNFCQYFKKITGMSPKECLTKIRMEKAKELIERESVTDTAFDVGYENISLFISNFKERYGATPKQYKKAKQLEQK